jgi:hypothetical protein
VPGPTTTGCVLTRRLDVLFLEGVFFGSHVIKPLIDYIQHTIIQSNI